MKATTGKGAVILPHGVLFRGNAEAKLREKILKRGYIKGVIGLPANLFYGTGIPASIIVLDNEAYGETGGQASHTGGTADLVGVAKACGIGDSRSISTMAEVETFASSLQDEIGRAHV